MSVTVQGSELPPPGVASPDSPAPLQLPAGQERPGRQPTLTEQPLSALLTRIARLEGSLGAALSLLRRSIIERKAPTREALAAEAGFALGMSPEAALAELDEVAQTLGVSSLR